VQALLHLAQRVAALHPGGRKRERIIGRHAEGDARRDLKALPAGRAFQLIPI